ncbi:MAG: DUF1549 domain-containing protein [Planctomycetes bacterium]|nr:DUF1549 domain-containing protein [Planctomycetota bacterium]
MTNRLVILCVWAVTASVVSGQQPVHQRIDKATAERNGGAMASLASDAEFLRRVYLDLTGIIPAAAETRKFLADSDPNKRAKTIDLLLASKDFSRRMREVVSVMLLERRAGTVISDQEWNKFVEGAFAADMPWDQFVRELISADGSDARTRPAIRFFVDGGRSSHDQMTQDVARLFLGMNLQCAQCHNDRNIREYEQAHYFGIYAYLRQSKLQTDKSQRAFLIETVAKDKMEFQSVFSKNKQFTGPRLPDRGEVAVPAFKKGDECAAPAKDGFPGVPKFRPRQLLARDLTAADNRRFVRNAVNRFWFLMMGRGLVHPLDLLHVKNPASHPDLLEFLVDDFVAHKFDVKYLLRQIALSQSYQRSSILPGDIDPAAVKPESYRVANAKGLSSEQLAWSLMRATGNLERIAATPLSKKSKFTYKDYVNGRLPAPDNLSDVMKLFAAAFGNSAGSPEVDFTPSASQSLFLLNDKLLRNWLTPRDGNLVDRLTKESNSDRIAEELYLVSLSRLPDDEEKALVRGSLERHKSRRSQALGDLAWALLTSAEFRLNH